MYRLRLVVGIACIVFAIWMFLSGEFSENLTPPILFTLVGVIILLIAKKGLKQSGSG
jgi:hypothetical protein